MSKPIPDHLLSHVHVALTYAVMGEARVEAAEVRRIDPTFSLESYVRRHPHKDPDNIMTALHQAGLK